MATWPAPLAAPAEVFGAGVSKVSEWGLASGGRYESPDSKDAPAGIRQTSIQARLLRVEDKEAAKTGILRSFHLP